MNQLKSTKQPQTARADGASMTIDSTESAERVAAYKAAARAAVEEARRKSKWKPKPEPSERRIQEPWPEQPEEQTA